MYDLVCVYLIPWEFNVYHTLLESPSMHSIEKKVWCYKALSTILGLKKSTKPQISLVSLLVLMQTWEPTEYVMGILITEPRRSENSDVITPADTDAHPYLPD
jgi:hypothetical protein